MGSRAGSKGNRIPMVRRRTESRDAEQEQPSVGRKKGISMVSRRRSNTAPPAEGDSGAIRNSIPSEELASEYRYSENTLTEKMSHFFEDLPTSYRSRSRAKTSPTAIVNDSWLEDPQRNEPSSQLACSRCPG